MRQNLGLMGTTVTDFVKFGDINISATMSNCYAIAKFNKNEVVDNNDITNVPSTLIKCNIYPNPLANKSSLRIKYEMCDDSNIAFSIYHIR
jgi:hypothetical protein